MSKRHRAPAQRELTAWVGRSDVRWITLGAITGAHGLRGMLRVKPYNPDSDVLLPLEDIASRADGELRVHRRVEVRVTGKGLLMQFDDVRSVEAATELRGRELCLPRDWLPPLEPGEFYHVDLEGLAAVKPSGEAVGVVERVHDYPAASVLRVRADGGVWEVPMREPYLVDVDLEQGRIVVDGLEDLELEPDRRGK